MTTSVLVKNQGGVDARRIGVFIFKLDVGAKDVVAWLDRDEEVSVVVCDGDYLVVEEGDQKLD